jgi:ribose transport system substrate-binding protein
VLSAVFAACGDDDSEPSSSEPAKTEAASDSGGSNDALEKAKAEITEFPGPSSSPAPEGGKEVVVVTCAAVANCQRTADGAVEAGEVLGWNVRVVDGKGDPAVWNAAIGTAIADKADGIILAAVVPPLVANAVTQAKAAKIPVVSVWLPSAIPGTPEGTVYGWVEPPLAEEGKTMADWVIEDSGGEAKIVQLVEPAFPDIKIRDDAFAAQIKSACQGCEILETVKFSLATEAQELPQAVVSALQKNPTADYVVAPFDNAALFAAQGIGQAGKGGSVKLVGYEGEADALGRIRDGQGQVADIAHSGQWTGFQAMDLLNRAFAGEEPINLPIASRLFDSTNIDSIEFEKGWQGDVDFRGRYAELWGK